MRYALRGLAGLILVDREKEEEIHKEISRGLLILGSGGVAGEGGGDVRGIQQSC